MATQIGGKAYMISPINFVRIDPSVIRKSICFNSEKSLPRRFSIHCSQNQPKLELRTCKNCKTQFDPLLNHPRACRYHTAHFGGETKRKFESVYSGGTLDTPDSGKVFQYWHCCGSEDPFDPGCTASPHASYDD
ncbi:OLC1v1010668C1 [Oldenlandia corymbosa var. corymbosa]|uniref:OLC1v1010668C1 n=1 Tax=Oldenlandia corymbosa var. corymbosa TaxID=529605 RepID=A0AAV1DTJ5_OLDCO|nr:OLC1v1010668C1 [Oldenlandia corymbosa var. corymbosa]